LPEIALCGPGSRNRGDTGEMVMLKAAS
jgi:hypothetical protein